MGGKLQLRSSCDFCLKSQNTGSPVSLFFIEISLMLVLTMGKVGHFEGGDLSPFASECEF